MPARRRFAHSLLALALLLAQQLLSAHPYAHWARGGDPSDQPSGPAELSTCVLCLVGASCSSALPTTGHPPFVQQAEVFEDCAASWSYYPPVALAFSSRAPPLFL
jgi:hypothetical protein